MGIITQHGTSSGKVLKAVQVNPESVPQYWDQVTPFISSALRYASEGEISLDQIRFFIKNELMQLFVVLDESDEVVCVAVTEIIKYPNIKVVRVVVLAGNLASARVFEDEFEAWALANGAAYIEGLCKPAQARLFRRIGYMPTYSLIRKDIRRKLQ